MRSIDQDTLALIPGDTPLEKHKFVQRILEICTDIAYPGRGSEAESKTLQDFVEEIAKVLPYP